MNIEYFSWEDLEAWKCTSFCEDSETWYELTKDGMGSLYSPRQKSFWSIIGRFLLLFKSFFLEINGSSLGPTYSGQADKEEEEEGAGGLRHVAATQQPSQAVSEPLMDTRACLASESVGDPLRKYLTFISINQNTTISNIN